MMEYVLYGFLVLLFCIGVFGVSVEVYGTKWVDDLWDKYQKRHNIED